jgi:predicted  nucleic acid-binding Zn-ribbon protein
MEQNQQLEHYENTLSRLDDKYKASKKERKALETEIAQLTIKQHALEEQQERQLVELMQVTTEK